MNRAPSAARPRIALTQTERNDDYVQALTDAGAEVVLIDPAAGVESMRALVDDVQGICLPGGWDVDPARYGESPHPSVQTADSHRDALELRIVHDAVARDLPLLAICRGMQVLNVARGGSLVQDIPTQCPEAGRHTVSDTATTVAHAVEVAGPSRLREAVDAGMSRQVNSRHHQAVRTLGHGLRVTATAPDGVIEAIELPDATFCVGVQWHPENFWRTGEMRPLFELFTGAARLARAPRGSRGAP